MFLSIKKTVPKKLKSVYPIITQFKPFCKRNKRYRIEKGKTIFPTVFPVKSNYYLWKSFFVWYVASQVRLIPSFL